MFFTTPWEKLANELNMLYFDVHKHIKTNKLYESYDRSKRSCIVDTDALVANLLAIISKDESVIIDSHMSHFLPKTSVDLCIICNCELKILKNRLEKRKYTKNKVRENLDSEIFEVCKTEALKQQHKIFEIDCSKRISSDVFKSIILKIKSN